MKDRCAYWSLTINEKAKCFNDLQTILNTMEENNPNIEYSYIKHNADDDDKNLHYHLVLYFKGKVTRFTTLQNTFEGAHIEQTNKQRYKRCIQYLVHKNNPEKEQYSQELIVSNIETSELADILNSDGYDFELFESSKLFDYLNECYVQNGEINMIYFTNRFGLDAISKYYFVIKDMAKDFIKLIHKVEFDNQRQDDITRAFNKYHSSIKQEWQLAKYYGYFKGDIDEYRNSLYSAFVDDVNNGLIDIKSILKEEN